MLFNSYTFILFFIGVLLLHALPLPWTIRKINLLLASSVFYAAWNPYFLILLWTSTLVDYFAARKITVSTNTFQRRVLLWVAITVNLSFLGFFKYGQFLQDNFIVMMRQLGVVYEPLDLGIVLPVAISFYTFETISYTVDVYRRRIEPCRSLLDYCLFIAFFPHLLAGPIVRAEQFLPQCAEPRRASWSQFNWGVCVFILGLFLKIALADGFFAPVVNRVYDPDIRPDMLAAWSGSLAFTGQIYCDFGGYSLCAVGLAACLGFWLPYNFHSPMASVGISDLWRRWHITLSNWLHDYVFVTLGGYRSGRLRAAVVMFVTMVLCGLWHGAAWTFVAFGALHGLYLAAEIGLRRARLRRWKFWRTVPARFILWLVTYLLATVAIVFFRAESLGHAFNILHAMFGRAQSPGHFSLDEADVILALVPLEFVIIFHWLLRDMTLEVAAARVPTWVISLCVASMLIAIVLSGKDGAEYIYFQF